jgi:hypothetical protein
MTTATAAKPRTTTSPRYPGYTIEQLGPTDYLMTKDGGIYAIAVNHFESHGWVGEIMTKQRRTGDRTPSWEAARTPFSHCVPGCIKEVERREAWIAKQATTRKPR